MIERLKNLIKNKTPVFYIGAGVALLSIIFGFVYVGAFISPNDLDLAATYNVWIPLLMILSGLIYVLAAFFKYDNYGLGLIGIASFVSLVIFIINFLPYGMGVANSVGMGETDVVGSLFEAEGITAAVVVIVFQIIIMIAANVLAWIPANSKKEKVAEVSNTETRASKAKTVENSTEEVKAVETTDAKTSSAEVSADNSSNKNIDVTIVEDNSENIGVEEVIDLTMIGENEYGKND